MATCTVCGAGLPAGSRFCPGCGTPTDSSTATTERKLVSILFADLVGSTAFASGEDPERVRAILDALQQHSARLAESTQLRLNALLPPALEVIGSQPDLSHLRWV